MRLATVDEPHRGSPTRRANALEARLPRLLMRVKRVVLPPDGRSARRCQIGNAATTCHSRRRRRARDRREVAGRSDRQYTATFAEGQTAKSCSMWGRRFRRRPCDDDPTTRRRRFIGGWTTHARRDAFRPGTAGLVTSGVTGRESPSLQEYRRIRMRRQQAVLARSDFGRRPRSHGRNHQHDRIRRGSCGNGRRPLLPLTRGLGQQPRAPPARSVWRSLREKLSSSVRGGIW